MRVLGIAFLFGASIFTGFYIAENRLSILKDYIRIENLLKNIILGIQSENLSITEIFKNIKKHCDNKTACFIENIDFKNFTDFELSDDKNANEILKDAFSVLGKYSAKEQIKELEFCRIRINELYLKNEKDIFLKAKLSKYSGVFCGMFFVIILI